MILVDTSVWIEHLRAADAVLVSLLSEGRVLTHPMVVGELALGNLHNRKEVLGLLDRLPKAPVATDDETLMFIERRHLMGRGIGHVDAHLLAAASLAGLCHLWTNDRRLLKAAGELRLAYQVPSRTE